MSCRVSLYRVSWGVTIVGLVSMVQLILSKYGVEMVTQGDTDISCNNTSITRESEQHITNATLRSEQSSKVAQLSTISLVERKFQIKPLSHHKFKPMNPNDENQFLENLILLLKPKHESWGSRISRSFRKFVQKEGEFGDQGYPTSGKEEEINILDECGCERKMMVEKHQTGEEGGDQLSSCSYSSYRRGGGQKVIGYSYYGERNSSRGKERKYFQGIKENLLLLPKHYPGWIIRVYYDLPTGHPTLSDLCTLACGNPSLDLCYVQDIPSSGDISSIFAMNWRFFPTLDPQVTARHDYCYVYFLFRLMPSCLVTLTPV